MNVSIEFAGAGDDAAIRGLLRRQTMPGRVRLAFCRDPEFAIGCAVTGDHPRVLVAREGGTGDVVGVACRSTREVFLNGQPARIGYFGQLRVDERFRGRWLVSRGFAVLRHLDRDDPLPLYLASIVDGNHEAAGVLVRRPRPTFPRFRAVAEYRTLVIRIRGQKATLRGEGEIVTARTVALSGVAGFLRREGSRRQLCSVWTEPRIASLANFGLGPDDILVARRGGQISGVMALWDQSAFKQEIVRGYSGWLNALAPVLPRVGQALRSAYVSLVSVADDDRVVFERLLRGVYNLARARGIEYLLIGLDARDPLLPFARAYRHVCYPSRLYLGSWCNGELSYDFLDDRPSYVDIATL